MVLADSHRISRVPRYSGADSILSKLHLRGYHALRLRFPADSAAVGFFLLPVLQPRVVPCDIPGLGSSAFARHYLRNHCYFLFLRVLRCFSSPRSPGALRRDGIAAAGFPHSDIGGSCGYLPLAAAFRSLSRPSSPPRATGIPHAPFSAFLFSFRLSSDLAALLAVSVPLAVPLDSSVRLLFFLVSLTLM